MRFSLIYVDCPWSYTDKNANGKRGACFKYPVMTLDDLKALPVPDIAAEHCLLAMWWVSPQPQEALDLVSAWGFTLKNMCGFTWHKLSKTGKKDHFGTGHLTRSNTENVLFATKGRIKRVSASVRGMITAPVGEHSAKPSEARGRLVQLMGDIPRVELFAREAAPGWIAVGNAIDGEDIACALRKLARA